MLVSPMFNILKNNLIFKISILVMLGTVNLEASIHFPKSFSQKNHDLQKLKKFLARDKEVLCYRQYESIHLEKVIICIHGSGSHGEYLHDLSMYLSKEVGEVIVPNLRGHFGSGTTPGDCAYIGQLEDDIMDLIEELSLQDKKIYLLGHSSGGGLAIRLAGSKYSDFFSGYILLAPAILSAPTMKKSGDWAKVSMLKILSISVLNAIGIENFNHSNVISFRLPPELQNGKETLSYTFNLNTSYHPKIPYQNDIKSLGDKYVCFVGAQDELMEPQAYRKIMNEIHIKIIDDETHLGITLNQDVMKSIGKSIHQF